MQVFPDLTITLYQMVPFVVLLIGLNLLLFQPMLKLLQERKRRVVGYASDAERLTTEAHELQTQVEQRLATAKVEAAGLRARLVHEAEAEGEKIIASARAEAEKELQTFREKLRGAQADAATQLKAEARSMSVEIASRVLGRSVA